MGPVKNSFRVAFQAGYGTGLGQFLVQTSQRLLQFYVFDLDLLVAVDAKLVVGVFEIGDATASIGLFSGFLLRGFDFIVATRGHTTDDWLRKPPGMMTADAADLEMPGMGKFDFRALGLDLIRSFQGDDSHGNTHIFISRGPGESLDAARQSNSENPQNNPTHLALHHDFPPEWLKINY